MLDSRKSYHVQSIVTVVRVLCWWYRDESDREDWRKVGQVIKLEHHRSSASLCRGVPYVPSSSPDFSPPSFQSLFLSQVFRFFSVAASSVTSFSAALFYFPKSLIFFSVPALSSIDIFCRCRITGHDCLSLWSNMEQPGPPSQTLKGPTRGQW